MIELTADKIWNDEVRDLFLTGAKEIKTDGIFSNTLYRLVQEIDSDLANDKDISHRLQQLPRVLASKRYIDENMKNFSDRERELSKEINEKALSLIQIARMEESIREEERREKANLNKKDKTDRLPNETIDIKGLYKVSANKRGRLF